MRGKEKSGGRERNGRLDLALKSVGVGGRGGTSPLGGTAQDEKVGEQKLSSVKRKRLPLRAGIIQRNWVYE